MIFENDVENYYPGWRYQRSCWDISLACSSPMQCKFKQFYDGDYDNHEDRILMMLSGDKMTMMLIAEQCWLNQSIDADK